MLRFLQIACLFCLSSPAAAMVIQAEPGDIWRVDFSQPASYAEIGGILVQPTLTDPRDYTSIINAAAFRSDDFLSHEFPSCRHICIFPADPAGIAYLVLSSILNTEHIWVYGFNDAGQLMSATATRTQSADIATPLSPVPIPGPFLLFGSALAMLLGWKTTRATLMGRSTSR